MGFLKKIIKKGPPGPKSPGMKKLVGGSSKPATKPMPVATAAPTPTRKPMAVGNSAKTPASRSTTPAAPAAPIGRGPRSRTPRQYEP